MSKEVWRDVKGYEGFYQISNLGRLKSLERTVRNVDGVRTVPECIMKFTIRSGYFNANLRKYGHKESKQIHRLVAEAFIPNPQNLPIVNHKDFNRKNNCVENLEWCTQAQNVRWSSQNMCKPKSTMTSSSGEKYIHKRNESFRVCIRQFNIDKSFHSMEEAKAFRDEVIRNERKYFEG